MSSNNSLYKLIKRKHSPNNNQDSINIPYEEEKE